MIGRNVKTFSLTPAELDIVKAGHGDAAMSRKRQVEIETYAPKVQALARARASVRTDQEKQKGAAYAEQQAKEPGAVKTDSGMIYQEIKAGTGEQPSANDRVKVHYTGTLIDGTVFDSSVKRKAPAEFPLRGVIPCWTEGVAKMKVGGKAKLVCPAKIAYGDEGRPPTIPGGATLTFEVELLEIMKQPDGGAPQMPGMPLGHPGMTLPPGAKPLTIQPHPATPPASPPPAKK
jgi:FKBP-type peptidyl-prolyl cis-trans isomerase FkpA